MAHLLLLEVPGCNDFDFFETALAQGHQISFFTADSEHYLKNGALKQFLGQAKRIVEIKPFDYDRFENRALEIHREDTFDALLCLIDFRVAEAARLAERLSLRYLNPKTALVMQDKFMVRRILADKGIPQSEICFVINDKQPGTGEECAVLPALRAPCDLGSQYQPTVFSEQDGNKETERGLNGSDRLPQEHQFAGQMLGCDTLSQNGKHVLLGINEKLMYPAPSCAIKGSCFPSDRYETKEIQAYVFSILDALDFNEGVTHTEILLSQAGPLLVEGQAAIGGQYHSPAIESGIMPVHLRGHYQSAAWKTLIGITLQNWIWFCCIQMDSQRSKRNSARSPVA